MLPKSNSSTIIGANIKLVGTLQDVDDITIHGRIEGEVASDNNIIIGETAEIKGPITAKQVVVHGKVKGSITSFEKLEISQGGRVYGSITTSDLIIQSGAIFVGKSSMTKKGEEAEKEAEELEHKPEE